MPGLTVIGCSSGNPHPRLACSCYLLQAGQQRILLDIGEGASSAMQRLGLDPRRINAIVISHLHADHVMGLPLFIQWNYILKRRSRLDIYAPSEAVAGIKSLFDLTYLYPLKLSFPIQIHPINPGGELSIGAVKVKAHPNRHLQRHRQLLAGSGKPNQAQCYSFFVQASRRRLVYSSDLGQAADLTGILAAANLLVVEASHVDFVALGSLLRTADVTRVLITHTDVGFDFQAARRELLRYGVRQIRLAREGLELDL